MINYMVTLCLTSYVIQPCIISLTSFPPALFLVPSIAATQASLLSLEYSRYDLFTSSPLCLAQLTQSPPPSLGSLPQSLSISHQYDHIMLHNNQPSKFHWHSASHAPRQAGWGDSSRLGWVGFLPPVDLLPGILAGAQLRGAALYP